MNERRVLENQSSNFSFFTLEDPEWTSLLEGLSLNPLRKRIFLLIQWILKLHLRKQTGLIPFLIVYLWEGLFAGVVCHLMLRIVRLSATPFC